MVKEVTIKNYKSIRELDFELGRVNVIIGENGAGKSNILEALILAAAAYQRKLDDEFLINRGIRVTDPQSMKSGFDEESQKKNIFIKLRNQSEDKNLPSDEYVVKLKRSNKLYGKWENIKDWFIIGDKEIETSRNLIADIKNHDDIYAKIAVTSGSLLENVYDELKKRYKRIDKIMGLESFLVYYPHLKAMIARDKESHIKPLGIYGDGLLEFLSVIKKQFSDEYKKAVEYMHLFSWFTKMEIKANGKDEFLNQDKLQIYDKYLEDGLKFFDQRTVNEGFLFILFYYLLFTSKLTPKFFAVDNVDASLNPRLCVRLMEDIVRFTKEFSKQTILTTHNPALLDGLDLFDDEQRLFVAYRNADGETKLKRVKPQVNRENITIKNSEAFIKGYFGALPKNF